METAAGAARRPATLRAVPLAQPRLGVGARGTAVAAVSTASNASVNLASRVPDQELQPVGMAFELHHQVTNLLGHPLPQGARNRQPRSEEHTSELQSPVHLV